MKKTLLIMAAALALGSGATLALTQGATKNSVPAEAPARAAEEVVTIATSIYPTTEYPLCVYSSNTTCATETLYPASLFDTNVGLDKYTITELDYPMVNNPGSGVVKVTVMLKTTTETALSSAYTENDFAVINNYEVDFSKITDKVMRIPLAKPIVMEKGQGLVVGFWTEFTDNRPSDSNKPSFEQVAINIPGKHTYYNGWSPSDMSGCTLQDSEFVAGLKVKVVEGEVSGGDTPKTIQTNIATSGYDTGEYPMYVGGSNNSCATETLYPASVIGKAISLDTYTITELAYPMKSNPGSGKVKVTVMFTTTPDESLSGVLAEDAFEVVAGNVELDFSNFTDNYMRIPLTKPYVMHKGEGLIVGMWTDLGDDRPDNQPRFEQVSMGVPGIHTYYHTWNPASMGVCNLQDTEYVAGVDFVYVEGEYNGGGEAKDVVDLQATGLTTPSGSLYTNKAYEFDARVFNNGTVDVEGYKVEIFNTTTNEVFASVEVEKKLAAGLSATVPVEITFYNPGTYQLAARVVLDTDEVADNNVSEMVSVEVEKLPYRAVSLTGATEAKMNKPETYTITVANDGNGSLEGYTVNLYLVREGMADLLVATSTDNPAIAAGQTAEVTLGYTFTLGGEFSLKGAVVIGDNEPSETAILKVNVTLDKLTPVIYEEIPKWDGTSFDFRGAAIGRNSNYNASQLLYTAERFGEHERSYQIQSLTFHIYNEEYSIDPTPIKIWLAQTDQTTGYTRGSDASLVPAEDFVLVYDGVLITTQNNSSYEVKLELQNTFMLENGKSLAINIVSNGPYDGAPFLYLCGENTGTDNFVAYTDAYNGGDDFSIYNRYGGRINVNNVLPVITFGYALEPLPAMMDLAVNNFEQSSASPTTDTTEPVSFRVSLENKGTVDVEADEYTVELVKLDQAGKVEKVLESYPGGRYIAAGATTNQTIKYAFTENGSYKLAARVVVDGETNEEDNMSQSIELDVTWVPKDGIFNVMTEGVLVYDAATSTLRVNVGEGVLSIVDLAGRRVAEYNLDGAAEIRLDLAEGIYVINANGKTLKIRK